MNRRILSSFLLIALIQTFHQRPVNADHLLYGGVGNSVAATAGSLLLIDDGDGSGVVVGDPVTPGGLSGLAFDSLGTLYGTSVAGGFSSLVTIDPDLGTLLTSIAIVDDRGPIAIGDLTVQPGTDILFGVRSNASSALGGLLYTIDPVTGLATLIGDPGTGTSGGLAFAPDGTLYLGGWDPGGGQTFFAMNTVDPTDGTALTTVAIDEFLDGLAVRADGTLFGTLGAGSDDIVTVDPDNGAIIVLGDTGVGAPSDLAFRPGEHGNEPVPEPGTWALFALGMSAVAVARRKRKA